MTWSREILQDKFYKGGEQREVRLSLRNSVLRWRWLCAERMLAHACFVYVFLWIHFVCFGGFCMGLFLCVFIMVHLCCVCIWCDYSVTLHGCIWYCKTVHMYKCVSLRVSILVLVLVFAWSTVKICGYLCEKKHLNVFSPWEDV